MLKENNSSGFLKSIQKVLPILFPHPIHIFETNKQFMLEQMVHFQDQLLKGILKPHLLLIRQNFKRGYKQY